MSLGNRHIQDPRFERVPARKINGMYVKNGKKLFALLSLALALSGCQFDVLAPSGYVAEQLRDVLTITTVLILVIVAPVMVAIVVIALRYRKSKGTGSFDPDFHHSSQLELLIWAAPLIIIIWLGALTWVSTHKLDPYRPLDTEATGVTEGEVPLEIQVVSMDWKWLFFYPQYGVATVNEVAAPVDRPIKFLLTSTEVMNAFYIPALAGMIYTMPSMETQLHAVMNKPGVYDGRSSHYSGAGFSGMRFKFHGLSDSEFDQWIKSVRESGDDLDRDKYADLLEPSSSHPVEYFRATDDMLYHDILNRCVEDGKTCLDAEMTHQEHASRADTNFLNIKDGLCLSSPDGKASMRDFQTSSLN